MKLHNFRITFIFQIGNLNHGCNNERFHGTNLLLFPRYYGPTYSVAQTHITHISSIRFDKGLMLKTSALETLYGGRFALLTELIKSINLAIPSPPPPIDAAPQFLKKLAPFINEPLLDWYRGSHWSWKVNSYLSIVSYSRESWWTDSYRWS